ncbi:MAG: hypothetical protein ACJA01_001740 [Saprospiraceae bacterium]|jgi:hypothetical protein
MSEATDADGIYYDKMNDTLYQLNRTDNVINAYSNVSSTPTRTATSSSDFFNGREIAVKGDKLVVTQDANDDNSGNTFYIYIISPTSITLDKKYDTDINLWGIDANGNTLISIVDNSNQVSTFDNFFSQETGTIPPTNTVTIEGMVRTHGVTFDVISGTLFLADIGEASSPTDGAFTIVKNWNDAVADNIISLAEQIRIEGGATFLGNPVDIAFNPNTEDIYMLLKGLTQVVES